MTELNNIESKQLTKQPSKYSKFLDNTKKAVRDVLVKTWIAASTMTPMATTTVIPASVNTITAIAPTASTAISTITLWAAAGLLTACGGGEDIIDTPKPKPTEKDTTPPSIDVNQSTIDVTWWKEIKISGNQLYIWSTLVASRSDNKTTNCNVELSFNWQTISSWTTINEEWTLDIKVSDEAWNTKNTNIKLNVTVEPDISWLENIQNLNMQVDQEINLLNWVTFGNGAELVKTEIELDWEKVEISDPQHYIPAYPWTCSIILTVKSKDGNLTEHKVDNLTIKALDYRAMEINNIAPEEILPIIWQVEAGDVDVYKPIEPLRLAEATKVRDMMWEYGAGKYSPEEYQQLMSRLNTGMIWELPKWYSNYEQIWNIDRDPSYHAHNERHILNTLVSHTKFKVAYDKRYKDLYNLTKNNPNSINIFWKSTSVDRDRNKYIERENSNNIKDILKAKNFIIFYAWTNIRNEWNPKTLKNKVYQKDISTNDKYWMYCEASATNWKSDNSIDRHMLVTIWTNSEWDIDQTNEIYESSKFPVWFHDKVLFAGRSFPYLDWASWKIGGAKWKYATSYPNYVNVAIADILFQLKADVPDADEFLEMVRSTCLTDYIRFDLNGDGDTNDNHNGQPETQPLQLMNPAWFFQKYLMPTDLPSSIQTWNTATLNKWFYRWVIFDIPWAEVKINWKWIAYNDTNKSLIKNQNPMTLEWRLNWDLCRKMWHKWKKLEWRVIVVDDKWNGLNIDKEFSINVQ